jgi:hypothetical protein
MEFEEAREAIQRAASVEELSAILFDLRNENGLAHLVYHAAFVPAFDKANPLLLLTYDDAWVKRYMERDYFRIDPVVLAGRKSFLPIDWLTVEHSSKEACHFFAEAESYGVGRHGFTLPIRGPAGERALFTITTNATDEHWHRWRFSHLRDFHLLAHYFHDRAMRLAGLRYNNVMRPLSPRERWPMPWVYRSVRSTPICARPAKSWNAPPSSRRLPRRSGSTSCSRGGSIRPSYPDRSLKYSRGGVLLPIMGDTGIHPVFRAFLTRTRQSSGSPTITPIHPNLRCADDVFGP